MNSSRGWPGVLVLMIVASCTTPKRPLAPRDSPIDRGVTNFSGTYCFDSMARNFREYNGGIGYLLPTELQEQSPVTVTQDAALLSLEYTTTSGARGHAQFQLASGEWRGGKLIAPQGAGGNPFGWYYSRSWLTVYRLSDGRLIVQRNDADTGLTCLFIPSHDKRESMLILDPATSLPPGAPRCAPAGSGSPSSKTDRRRNT